MQTCRRINVHVVNTDNVETYMNVNELHHNTYQCAQYKLKLFTKHDSRNTKVSIFLKDNYFFVFPCCSSRENLSNHVPTHY